jgi:hypothetical protein
MLARQKTRAPQAAIQRLVPRLAAGDEHYECRQIVVGAPQAVADPRAHARPPRLLASGLDEGDRRIVVDRLGVQRVDEAQLVHDLRGVRHQLADRRAALAVPVEFEERGSEWLAFLLRGHRRQPLPHADGVGDFVAVPFFQLGLVVEQLHL